MKYQTLLEQIQQIHDLRKAARVLTWDREVVMPKGGESDRIQQIATLQKISHTLYTSDEIGELIEGAAQELNGVNHQSPEASLIRFLRRDYNLARKLPVDFVTRASNISSQATATWKQAREYNQFATFEPWLEQLVELAREKAEFLGYHGEPYDALLDVYEPGATTTEISKIFNAAKEELLSLYKMLGRRRSTINDRFLRQPFDIEKQKTFATYLASAVGYDFERGHLGMAVHPFSTSLSLNDVRITTRYNQNFLISSIFATLHEAGHAIYVQNVHPDLNRTPLARETSAGLDESQSRLIENMVGRSVGFWIAHLPKLRELFPSEFESISIEDFYRAINKVQPCFIRVEADELTYNMHIILRFELEQAILRGDLRVAEIPTAWNDKMKEFLGIVPPTDREGCLQDIHWAMVGFGYFPTYALGNLYAAQFFEAAQNQNPDISCDLANGKIDSLLYWLRTNIHQHGRKFTPSEIVLQATGKPLSHHAFVRYATDKFTRVYNL